MVAVTVSVDDGFDLKIFFFSLGCNPVSIRAGIDYGPTPSSTIGWEKRNNVNAKEYGYYAED